MDLFGFESGPINIATPIGMGFVQGLSLASLAFILTAQMFRAMNPSLEEAAKVHGMGFGGTLRRITLPLAMPGILAAVIYIVTIAVATFDVPAILGLGNRVYMLSTFIYLKVNPQGSGLPEYGITGAVGVFMIIIAGLLTMWYGQVLRQGHRFEVVTGKGYRPALIPLGRWAIVGWCFIGFYALLSKILPLLLIAYAAMTPYFAPPSAAMMRRLSFIHFYGMDWNLVMRGLKNTLTLVTVVPVVVVLFAFCISWLVVRSRNRARYVLEFGAFLPHALPEVILAVGALDARPFCRGRLLAALRLRLADCHSLRGRPPGLCHTCDQRLAAPASQGAGRSRVRRGPFEFSNRMANSVSASQACHALRLDLDGAARLSGADRGRLSRGPGQHHLTCSGLELLV